MTRPRACATPSLVRAAILVLALVAGGCAAPGVLVAHDGQHRLSAHDDPSGVTVVITSGVWDGEPRDLEQKLTVMHVLVANLGDQPVLLAPGDIELRDSRGFRYELLDAGATFARVETGNDYDRAFDRSYDPGGSMQFETLAGGGDMARLALPWGVLEPNTQIRGYVYFESITPTARQARLVWHLQTPEHLPLVDAMFDLFVART